MGIDRPRQGAVMSVIYVCGQHLQRIDRGVGSNPALIESFCVKKVAAWRRRQMTYFEHGQYEEGGYAKRTASVYRPVLIESNEIAGFCLLRSISSEGMVGRFHTQIAPNTEVTIQFNPLLTARGKASWSADGMIGIQFTTPIDLRRVLLGMSTSPLKGKVYRAPRLQMQANIQIVVDGRTIPAEVQEISQKGLKVRTDFLRSGEEITVLLDGLEPKKADVRWTQPQLAGLNFVQPLAFDQLGEWVIRQHERVS